MVTKETSVGNYNKRKKKNPVLYLGTRYGIQP